MPVIYLIRHGQASAGKSDYDHLSSVGEEQARTLGRVFAERGITPARVVSGGMKRHDQTAGQTLKAMGLEQRWTTDSCWREYDHQDILIRHKKHYANRVLMMADLARSGDPRRAFQHVFEEALRRWVGGRFDDEYEESWAAFRARIERGLSALESGAEGPTFVFTSGGAISTVIAKLWGLDDPSWVGVNQVLVNCGVTKVAAGRRGLSLSTVNEHEAFDAGDRRLLTYR